MKGQQMHHLTQSQTIWLYISVFVGLLWTAGWLWFWWMVGRIVRWTYLEKKHDWRSAAEELNSQVHQFHQ
jgi:hypothetical protein